MTSHFNPRWLCLALAGVLGTAAMTAQAAPAVLLTAAENLAGASGPGTALLTPPSPAGGDFFHNGSSASASTFFHTYGSPGGLTYFGARVSGTGTFFGKTSATYTDSITNNTGVAQMVVFNFNVDSGNIGLAGSGSGYADLLLSLKFGTDVVARDHGRINYNNGVGTCNSNLGNEDVGVLASYLNCAGSGDSASGSAGSYSASRLLAVGDTLNVTYDIVAEVAGTLNSTTAQEYCSNGPIGLTGPAGADAVGGLPNVAAGDFPPGYSGCQYFNAIARSGDPANFSPFTPGNFGLTASPAVPEPGALALVALALAGLASVGRRRQAG